ncbi:MAG: hypothetical protein LBD59_04245 [Prevotellaceae bacterium]|jgi:hypothetical protein|nr:hypothetical protein [Prevotellaceae bacterium]
MAGYVESRFIEPYVNRDSGNIVFDYTELDSIDKPVVATKLKSLFIPAIFYWQWNRTIKCKIDPRTVGQAFQEHFLNFADELNLYEKLQGRQLEIKLEKIPNSFIYTDNGFAIIYIYGYMMSSKEAILPQVKNLVISYKLTDAKQTVQEGRIEIADKNEPIYNQLKLVKTFTWSYIDVFKHNNKTMAQETVEQLLTDI